LAKELTEKLRNKDGTYNLTEMTGSPRYMAPEVANANPYNATADCYSFSILLWQIISLQTPYELYTPKSLREKVYNGAHKRPPVNEEWSVQVKLLLRRGWTQDLHDRITMDAMVTILRKECVCARHGDDSGLEHNRRRSTFVFRPNRKSAQVS
jgi:serine/threonine protein kinase